MPLPADHAARRRDERLARARRLTLWAAGGAAAASLGLGAAFAHALPGHRAPSRSPNNQPQVSQPQVSQPTGAPASPIQQPAQPPANTSAPPQTTSGGS